MPKKGIGQVDNKEIMDEEKSLESVGDGACLKGLCRFAINFHNRE